MNAKNSRQLAGIFVFCRYKRSDFPYRPRGYSAALVVWELNDIFEVKSKTGVRLCANKVETTWDLLTNDSKNVVLSHKLLLKEHQQRQEKTLFTRQSRAKVFFVYLMIIMHLLLS